MLPACIGNLDSLESLQLSNNALQVLPKGNSIRAYKAASYASVFHHMIGLAHQECFSYVYITLGVVSILEIGQLKKLEVLDAMSNKLRSIPSELASCSSLKRLLLDRNLLSWLPRQLSTMSSLEEISAASNKLLYLPLGWLSNCFFFVRAKRPLWCCV